MNMGVAEEAWVFADAASLSAAVFGRFYREVLVPAFPPEELESIDVVRAVHHGPGVGCRGVVALRDGAPVGGALGEYYPRGKIALLAYLAVRDDMRRTGLGSALLASALSAWREALAPTAILAEVEDPRARRATRYGDPVARLRFYERAGSKLLPVPYTQPAVGPGFPPVSGMFLICLDPDLWSVPRDEVLAFLDEYMDSMGTNTDDPDYRALRGAIESHEEEIPLWLFSRVAEMPQPVVTRRPQR